MQTFNEVKFSQLQLEQHLPHPFYYTPDIRSMWGYIDFAFPFVRSFVRSYVRSFVRTFVRSSFCHMVKVFALKFMTSYCEDPSMDFIYILHDERYRSKVLISTILNPVVTLGSRSQT